MTNEEKVGMCNVVIDLFGELKNVVCQRQDDPLTSDIFKQLNHSEHKWRNRRKIYEHRILKGHP